MHKAFLVADALVHLQQFQKLHGEAADVAVESAKLEVTLQQGVRQRQEVVARKGKSSCSSLKPSISHSFSFIQA